MRRREVDQWIEMEAIGLDIDESVGDILCPFCQGGRSGERKFSITRTDSGLVYNCYRASCSAGRGFIATRGDLLAGSAKVPSSASKWKGPYRGEFLPLTSKDHDYIQSRFDLSPAYMGFLGINELNQYVMEIRTSDGYVRGYLVRRGCWSGDPPCYRSVSTNGPKARAYLNNDGDISLSWHLPAPGTTSREVVVVEDQMSAAKVSQAGLVGVALTGSYLSEDKVKEISLWRPSSVTIALDADATGAAFSAARKWGLAFPKIRVLVLSQDIKDMKRHKVQELLI